MVWVLLETYLSLTGVGAGLWLIGHHFGMTGVASIGGVLVLAIGGAVVSTGLVVQSGQQVTYDYEEVNQSELEAAYNDTANETDVIRGNGSEHIVVNRTTEPITRTNALTQSFGDAGPLSFGGLQMLVGGLLISQHLADLL